MNYWMLQANPDKFRIVDWLKAYGKPNQIDCWHISQLKEEVKPGDTAFIWKAKGSPGVSGIYAKVVVVLPQKSPLSDIEGSYFIDKAERKRLEKLWEITIKYCASYTDRPLLLETIREIPELKIMSIIRNPRRGIQRVKPEQGRIIESMLD